MKVSEQLSEKLGKILQSSCWLLFVEQMMQMELYRMKHGILGCNFVRKMKKKISRFRENIFDHMRRNEVFENSEAYEKRESWAKENLLRMTNFSWKA